MERRKQYLTLGIAIISVPLHPDDRHYTTFITPWGRYQYCTAPQGNIASGDGYSRYYDEVVA